MPIWLATGSKKSGFPGFLHRSLPRRHVEPGEDAGDMSIDRTSADEENLRDFPIGASFGDQAEDIQFPWRYAMACRLVGHHT
jgi:hypothetical protein